MRRYAWMAMAILIMTLAASSCASAANVYLDKQSGDTYDLYISPAEELNADELIMLVNYGESDLWIKVTGNTILNENKTYYSGYVGPRDSAFIELELTDVQTDYLISLEQDGRVILELNKARGSYYLPPPKDSWYISPPGAEEGEPAEFTQSFVNALKRALTIDILTYTTIAALLGVALGAIIKVGTKFLVPYDCLSCGLYATVCLDGLWLDLAPWEKHWWIPFLIGYWIGFLLWHIPWVAPLRIDSETKTLRIDPKVIYYPDDRNRPCIQEQSNRALLRRWLGIHHEMVSDAGINPDWMVSVKKPYWPRVTVPSIWVQKSEVGAERVKVGRFTLLKRTTRLALANASRMPYYLWLQSTKAFQELTNRLENSENERVRMRLARRAEATAISSDMLIHSTEVSTHEAVRDHFLQGLAPPERITLDEHRFTTTEETETEPLEEEDEEEPTEAEEDPPQKGGNAGSKKARKGAR